MLSDVSSGAHDQGTTKMSHSIKPIRTIAKDVKRGDGMQWLVCGAMTREIVESES